MKKIIPFHKEIPFKTNLEEVTSISLEHTIHPEKEKVEGDFIVSGEYKISDNSNCVESFSYELPFEAEFPNCNLDKAIIDIHDFYYEIMNSSILTVHIELCVQNIIEDPVILELNPEPIKEVEEVYEEKNTEQPVLEEKRIEEYVKQQMEEQGKEQLEKIERKIQDLFDKEVVTEAISEPVFKEVPKEESDEEMIEEKEIEPEVEEEKRDKVDEILTQMDTKETYATYKVYIVRENDTLETIMEKYDTTRELLSLYNDLNEIKPGDKIMIPSHDA